MMVKYPAIALIELSSIATGILCADAMIKRSPITVLKSGTVHNGKYLILIGGSIASVEESYTAGLTLAANDIIDHVILPDVHEQVHHAIFGKRLVCVRDSIGIIETSSVAAIIKSTDAAIKGADIDIVEIRLADHLGGKSFSIVSGKVEDVQLAVEIACERVTDQRFWINKSVIANLGEDLASQINQSTYFEHLDLFQLQEGEI
jgi:microcompartment protein CcmL/EutN